MNQSILLDARLAAAAHYVRRGAVFADVGSDHGYLPVFLVENGQVSSAIASDISLGSIASARRNIAEHHLEDQIETVVCDGVAPLADRAPTDIAICGMGGELIADIIDRAKFVFDSRVRLILQPMSRPHLLRRYLAEHGFARVDETVCIASDRVYFCICAEYDGVRRTLSLIEEYLGFASVDDVKSDEREAMYEGACRLRDTTVDILKGKSKAGIDTAQEFELISALDGFVAALENLTEKSI